MAPDRGGRSCHLCKAKLQLPFTLHHKATCLQGQFQSACVKSQGYYIIKKFNSLNNKNPVVFKYFPSIKYGGAVHERRDRKGAKMEIETEGVFKYHLMPKCHGLKKFNRILMHSFPQGATL